MFGCPPICSKQLMIGGGRKVTFLVVPKQFVGLLIWPLSSKQELRTDGCLEFVICRQQRVEQRLDVVAFNQRQRRQQEVDDGLVLHSRSLCPWSPAMVSTRPDFARSKRDN